MSQIIYPKQSVLRYSLFRVYLLLEKKYGKKNINFPALNATSKENLRALSKAIYQYEHPEADSFPEYATFDDAFNEISRLSKKEAESGAVKLVSLEQLFK